MTSRLKMKRPESLREKQLDSPGASSPAHPSTPTEDRRFILWRRNLEGLSEGYLAHLEEGVQSYKKENEIMRMEC